MKSSFWILLLLLLIASRLLPLYFFKISYSWDECLYLTSGIELAKYGKYIRDCVITGIEERPNVLPLLITLFYRIKLNPILLSPIFSIFFLLVYFLIIKRIYSKQIAILSLILLSISPTFWFLSERPLVDVPGSFFVFIVLTTFYLGLKDQRYFLITAISAGIGAQAHFIMPVVLIVCFIFLLMNKKIFAKLLKNRYSYISSAVLILITILWIFLFNNRVFPSSAKTLDINTLINYVMIYINVRKTTLIADWIISFFVYSFTLFFSVGLLFPFLFRFLVKKKNDFEKLIVLVSVVLVIFYVIFRAANPFNSEGLRNTARYMLPMTVFFVVFSVKELVKIRNKKTLMLVFALVVIANIVASFILFDLYGSRAKNQLIKNALTGVELEKNSSILTIFHPYTCYYFPESDSYHLLDTKEEYESLLEELSEDVYLAVAAYKSPYLFHELQYESPEYVKEILLDKEPVHEYTENNNSIMVFKVR